MPQNPLVQKIFKLPGITVQMQNFYFSNIGQSQIPVHNKTVSNEN